MLLYSKKEERLEELIEEGFDRILKRVSKPYQYVGNEYNACKKEMVAVSVKICLGFPDIYEKSG